MAAAAMQAVRARTTLLKRTSTLRILPGRAFEATDIGVAQSRVNVPEEIAFFSVSAPLGKSGDGGGVEVATAYTVYS